MGISIESIWSKAQRLSASERLALSRRLRESVNESDVERQERTGLGNYTGDEVQELSPIRKRFIDMTPEEHSLVAARGGIQKGINCAKRRTMREWAKALGEEEVRSKMGKQMARSGQVVLAQYKKAMKGDTQAAKFLADLLGEMGLQLPTVDQTIVLKID